MDEKPTKNRSRWPALVMALVLLLPPAYATSAGPLWPIARKGHVNSYITAYRPLIWLADHSKAFGRGMEWYGGLWIRDERDSFGWDLPAV